MPVTRSWARELTERYGTYAETVNRAYAKLQAAGLVERRPGVGMFVKEPRPLRRVGPQRYARHRWKETTVTGYAVPEDLAGETQQGDQTQTVDTVEADDVVAAALDIPPGESVYRRSRVVTRKGEPTHTAVSYYRRTDVEDTPITDPRPGMAGRGGSFAILAARGMGPEEITEELHTRPPTEAEAETLRLAPGEAIVQVRRFARDASGRVVEYACLVHAASRFVWEYTFKVPE